jgi:hypothetical protein
MENSCKFYIYYLDINNCKKSIILLFYDIYLLSKFNGLILLYCQTHKSISRVSGAYDHKTQKGKVLGSGKVTLGIIN